MKRKNRIINLLLLCLSISMFFGTEFCFADHEIEYIKGKPLTESEIEEQKAMEPKLNDFAHINKKRIELKKDPGYALKGSPRKSSEKYDMRDKRYAGYVKVKDQSTTGLCWAFSVTTTAEIEYLHEKTEAGESVSDVEFSPTHLGYFFFNRINDPLGNTALDKNIISDKNYNYISIGGDNILTMQALANWGGLANESKAPFSTLPVSIDKSLAYSNDIILKNAKALGSVEAVKEEIINHGAVTADIYYDNRYMDYNTAAYYDFSDLNYSNHVITIVGWDDTYSKDNFNSNNSSFLRKPNEDGAWIVQNSYGSEWGDGGYFYVSYEDTSLSNAMVLDMQEKEKYDYNYQYDGNANPASISLYAGDKAANVFKVKEAWQQLKAIGLTTWNEQATEYNISVYTDVNNVSNPESGFKMSSFNVKTDGAGFYTFELPENENVILSKDSIYSIVITMKGKTDFGIESEYIGSPLSFECGLGKDQSLIYDREYSTWLDSYDYDFCARIKGFAVSIDEPDNASDRLIHATGLLRMAGSGRYETAMMAADGLKKSFGINKFDNIIVACGDNYPDALTGSYLAKVKNAPILLVNRSTDYEKSVKNYITKNLKNGGTVYILGGEGAVSKRFEKSLSSFKVKRLAGDNRYDTNIAILKEAGVSNEDMLICTGDGFADSLSASAVGKPILLAAGSGINSDQTKYLKSLKKGNIYLIGGTGAVSNKIGTQLRTYDKDGKVERVSGVNRYKTSTAVAKKFFSGKCEASVFAYAYNFPDGLSGGPLAMSVNAPLILTDNSGYAEAKAYAKTVGIRKAVVLGGSSLISDAVIKNIIRNY